MTQKIDADVVIIGSGAAGALTALRLMQKGVRNIVILEAGPRVDRSDIVTAFKSKPLLDLSGGYPNPDSAPRPDWSGKTPYIVPTGPAVAKIEYLRVVGGTTWHWAACTPRMLPVDFRLKSTYGVGLDWPIDYGTLEPYYTDVEQEIGVAGDSDDGSPRSKPYPLPPVPLSYCDKVIAEGVKALGITFIPRPAARATKPYAGRGQCQGFGTCAPICPSGAQYAAAQTIAKVEKTGVRVMDNTRADRLTADGVITSVEAKKSDGTPVIVKAKIYVIAANAIESPRLLLMSVSEKYPNGLGNSSGRVGRNFMEHPTLICRMTMPRPVWPGRGPESIATSPTFRDGDFRRTRPACMLSIENRAHMADVATRLLDSGMEPPELDKAIRDGVTREIEIDAAFEQLPDLKNGITLDWTRRDRAGQPIMNHYWSFGGYEQAGFDEARKNFNRIADALGAKISLTTGPIPLHHPMGMTIMGNDPKTSVLDSFCRSHDHRNLFVVSSSVFPSGGTANPTLTLAALGFRAADEIIRQLHS
jgi:choline dehydrogenase-like flavoprotein